MQPGSGCILAREIPHGTDHVNGMPRPAGSPAPPAIDAAMPGPPYTTDDDCRPQHGSTHAIDVAPNVKHAPGPEAVCQAPRSRLE